MTRQRLGDAVAPTSDRKGGQMRVGETRTILDKNRDGNVRRTLTLVRTTRRYVDDLCDAYNAARTSDDFEWYVDASENLRLRDIPQVSVNRARRTEADREADRKRWVREHETESRPFAPPEARDDGPDIFA